METTNTFEIDLDGNRLLIVAGDSSEQLTMDTGVEDWTPATLVQWLDRKLHDPWISQTELLAWLGGVVTHLTQVRGLPLAQLMRCKFILARKLGEKIRGFRQMERDRVYQLNLFGPKRGWRFLSMMASNSSTGCMPTCRSIAAPNSPFAIISWAR